MTTNTPSNDPKGDQAPTSTVEELESKVTRLTSDLQVANNAVADWTTKFTSLQGKQSEWTEGKEKLTAAQERITLLEADAESTTTTVTELTKTKGELQTDMSRMKILMKYPALIPLEAEGALPSGHGEDLDTQLAALTSFIGAASTQSADDAEKNARAKIVDGSTPKSPTPPVDATLAALNKQMNKAIMDGENDEYQKLYQKYLTLSAKKE